MAKNSQFDVIITGKDALSGVLARTQKSVKSFIKDLFSIDGLLKGLGAVGVGLGLGALFRGAIAEAKKAQEEISRLRIAVRNAGSDFEALRPAIDQAVDSVSALAGLAKGDVREGLQQMITMTGDAGWSINQLALVADVAAGRHISFSAAAELVAKVGNGNTKIMKELGVATKDPAVAMQELAKRYRGFAENEGKGLAGQLQRLKNGWNDNLEALGNAITGSEGWKRATSGLVELLGRLAQFVEANEAFIGDLGNAAVWVAEKAMPVLGRAVVVVVGLFDGVITGWRRLWALFTRDVERANQLADEFEQRNANRKSALLGGSQHLGMVNIPGGVGSASGGRPRGGATDAAAIKAAEDLLNRTLTEQTRLREKLNELLQRAVDTIYEIARDPALEALSEAEAGVFQLLDAGGISPEQAKITLDQIGHLRQIVEQKKQAAKITELQQDLDEGHAKALELLNRDAEETRQRVEAFWKEQQRDAAEQLELERQLVLLAQQRALLIGNAVEGALQLAKAFGLVSDRTASILTNITQVAAGIGPLTKALSIGKMGGASGIAATALPVIGGIAGLASSIFGGAERDREAARRLRQAMEDWHQTLDDWIAATQNAGNAFAQSIRDIAQRERDAIDELNRILEERSPGAVRALNAAGGDPQQAIADLTAQLAKARAIEVAQLEAQIAALKEYAAALEKSRAAVEAARAEATRAAADSQAALSQDARVRLLRAQGLDDQAAIEEQAHRHAKELEDARRAEMDVTILLAAQEAERAKLLADIAEREAERIAQEEREQQAIRDDLEVRKLIAEGRHEEAAAMQRELQRQELMAGITDEATRALAELVFALEDAAIAAAKAAELTRQQEDLEVELLRAKGMDREADILALQLLRERTIAEAIAAGQTEEYIAKLGQLFDLKLEEIEEKYAPQIAVSAGGSAGAAAGERAHASAENITVHQANLIVDILRSSYSVLRSIELNTRTLGSMGATAQMAVPAATATFSGPVQIAIGNIHAGFGATPEQVVRAMKRAIEKELGAELQQRKRDRGNAFA